MEKFYKELKFFSFHGNCVSWSEEDILPTVPRNVRTPSFYIDNLCEYDNFFAFYGAYFRCQACVYGNIVFAVVWQ